ncbi:MAG TPA: hypothetical protein VN673_15040 [Clostridia bacterium]|nr:hypothetical protein [Clostridia bacterium]
MVNRKSLWAVLSVFSMVMGLVGLVRFAVDLWHYFHATGLPSRQVDYRGLWMALAAVIISAFFLLLFCKTRNWLRANGEKK